MQVSVVILCFNERERIADCLDSLAIQEYPAQAFEILIVDNGSTDGTLEILSDYATRLDNLRVVTNPVRGIAPGRNVGLAEAKYPYVAFTDADCILQKDWLSSLVEGWEKCAGAYPDLVAVGGTNRAPDMASAFYDAVNVVLKTPLGNRNSTQGCEFGCDKVVDHIPTLNVMYDKQAVLAIGGFDEEFLMVCEDPDLNYRLEADGKTMLHLCGCEVIHAFKPGLMEWARKIFGYGQGRTQLLRKHPRKMSPVYLVPPAITMAYVLAFLAPVLGIWAALPAIVHMSAMFGYALLQCIRKGSLHVLMTAWVLYLVTQISFGAGQLWGMHRTPTESFRRKMQRAGGSS